jgi:GNAT superfamily N-acetyltransferase
LAARRASRWCANQRAEFGKNCFGRKSGDTLENTTRVKPGGRTRENSGTGPRVLPPGGFALASFPSVLIFVLTLQMRRVTDEAQLMVYADINCEGYGFLPDWGRMGLRGTHLWTERAHSYLGYEGDHAVCAASAIAHDGNLYLALVATRPNAQRKGYGEAVVRHVLQSAHDCTGLSRTTLHASDAGCPVYRRLGYHKTASVLAFKLSE